MSDCLFPLEILEKFASHLDGNYAAQARMCLVSRALHIFTRPRLYHSFSSITLAGTPQTNGAAHAAYLKTIIHNRHLAALVHDYTLLVTPQSVQWPRDVPIALLSMPNLKELALINRNPEEPSHHLDLFRYVFDSDRKPFQLTSFRLHWLGSNNGRVFESMMLSTFLSKQTTIEDLHLSYHTALTGERDLPNLRKATIDWSNWEYVVPGRPLKSLIVEGDMGSARSVLKKTIVPGSPLDRTLQNLKYLHMDAQVMDALSLPQHLSSLEVLISLKFEDKFRKSLFVLPKLKVLCLIHVRSTPMTRKTAAKSLFSEIPSLTDVFYSAPIGLSGSRQNFCERFTRSSQTTPEVLPQNSYLEFAHVA